MELDYFAADFQSPLCRMIKRAFAALVFGALVSPASAQDAKLSVEMIGIGSMSCAHWRSTKEDLVEGTIWIYPPVFACKNPISTGFEVLK
jgi:hypothetical protein